MELPQRPGAVERARGQVGHQLGELAGTARRRAGWSAARGSRGRSRGPPPASGAAGRRAPRPSACGRAAPAAPARRPASGSGGSPARRARRSGSKTMAPRMWRWVVGDSRARNAPSSPVRRAHGVTDPSTRSRRGPARTSSSELDLDEPGRLHPLDHQLGDPVAPLDPVGDLGIGVDQQHGQLVPVAGVDQSGGVEAGHPVAEGQSAPGLDEAGVSLGEGQGDPGRAPWPARRSGSSRTSMRATRSAPASPGVGVAGQRQVGVEAHHRAPAGPGRCPPPSSSLRPSPARPAHPPDATARHPAPPSPHPSPRRRPVRRARSRAVARFLTVRHLGGGHPSGSVTACWCGWIWR